MKNLVILVGHLGQDPKIGAAKDGSPYAQLSVATERPLKGADGQRSKVTEWNNVVVWSAPLVEIAKQFLRKGSKVYIEGTLATRKWTDGQGVERMLTEVLVPTLGGRIQLLDRREKAPTPGGEDDYEGADYAEA